jgi:hypothetical protein
MVDHARIGSWNMFSIVQNGFQTITLNQSFANGTNDNENDIQIYIC